jgi:hypothetical protein
MLLGNDLVEFATSRARQPQAPPATSTFEPLKRQLRRLNGYRIVAFSLQLAMHAMIFEHPDDGRSTRRSVGVSGCGRPAERDATLAAVTDALRALAARRRNAICDSSCSRFRRSSRWSRDEAQPGCGRGA